MAKKRQQDFQKVQLRVGKTLPRGRNITNTSFQAKKIVTTAQLSNSQVEVTLKSLLKQSDSKNSKIQVAALGKLEKYIYGHDSDLPTEFSTILHKLGTLLNFSDGSVRKAALSALQVCTTYLSDEQMKCFLPDLLKYLNCMMTSANVQVCQDSLVFLDHLLSAYPKLMSQSMRVLSSLLNMISGTVVGKRGDGNKRKLKEILCSGLTSREWRVTVLNRITRFFEILIRNQREPMQKDLENYDCLCDNVVAYRPIYTHSGSTPMALLNHPWHGDSSLRIDSMQLKSIMHDLLSVLCDIIGGELGHISRSGNKAADYETIQHLSDVIFIVCLWEDWVAESDDTDSYMGAAPTSYIAFVVQNEILKKFPFTCENLPKAKKKDCSLELNMAICYLCSKYNLKFKVETQRFMYVYSYFCAVLKHKMNSSVKEMTLTLKCCKNFFDCNNLQLEHKIPILLGLFGIMEDENDRTLKNMIRTFIKELTFDYKYKDIYNCDSMKIWYEKILPKELTEMIENLEIDKDFLKYLMQTVSMGVPSFMKYLDSTPISELINLLRHPDEDIQITACHFISHLTEISADDFHKLDVAMQNPKQSSKISVRLIRTLATRLTRKEVPYFQRGVFFVFLLNVAIDTIAIDADDSTVIPEEILKLTPLNDCKYNIIPSEHWKAHADVFQACLEYIYILAHERRYQPLVIRFYGELLLDAENIPIHCAISLLRLSRHFRLFDCEQLTTIYRDLIYSVLFAVFKGATEFTMERAKDLGFPELQESITLHTSIYLLINKIEELLSGNNVTKDSVNTEFILRIFLKLMASDMLTHANNPALMDIFKVLEHLCRNNEYLMGLLQSIWNYF